MFKHKCNERLPTPPRKTAPPSKEKGVMQYCPINDTLCKMDCAWYLQETGCAIAILAIQHVRQGDELYAIAEIMQGCHMESNSEGGDDEQ